MTDVNKLITDNIDVWISAIKKRNAVGRGSSKKIQLTGIKKLRELILELAVRGKLVPQDANDEPASVLLERIAEEKAQLTADKKIRKQKELAVITNEEKPFNIPETWIFKRFGDVMFNRDGERKPVSADKRKGIQGQYDYYGASGVIDQVNEFLFDKSLLLIGEDGANLISRSTPIAFLAHGKYWVNNHAHVLDGITIDFLEFIALHINAISLEDYITGTAQPKMNQAKMNSIVLAIPPEAEQHRIVAKVDELMALCDQLEQKTDQSLSAHQTLVEVLLATLTESKSVEDFQTSWQRITEHFDLLFTTEQSIEQLKQTILQLAVMGKLVPQNPSDEPASVLLEKIAEVKAQLIANKKIKKQKPLLSITDEEKPFDLPNSWEWCRLQESIDVRDGTHDSPKDAVSGETYPLVTSKDFKAGDINFDSARQISAKDHFEISKRSHVAVDDILFSMIGGNIGNQVIVKDERAFSIKNVALFKYYDKQATAPYYFKIYTENLASVLQESAIGGAQPFISLGALRKLVFALPPLAEQHRIVAKVDELMALCEQLKARLADAQTTQLHLADAVVENALSAHTTVT